MIEMIIYGTIKSEPKKLKNKSENSGFLMESNDSGQDIYVFTPTKLLSKKMTIGYPVMVVGRFIEIWNMGKNRKALTVGAHKIVDMLKVISQTGSVMHQDKRREKI